MRISGYAVTASLSLLALVSGGCARQPASEIDAARLAVFAPLPDVSPSLAGAPTRDQTSLGRMLFYETRLSKSQEISCNSCHDLARYGVDGEPTSEGHKGQRGDRNSPTVYNAAAHFAQFWDGRAPDVEAQAKGPVMNPVEMAMVSEAEAVAVLKSMPEYVAAFQRAFPDDEDPVTFDNMAAAIGAFERRLMTPARWDKFLKGDQAALTPAEKTGLNAFVAGGCPTCHAGVLLGGNLYQKLGVAKPYPDTSDAGRFKVTRSDSDRMFFKVPSLRNVEKTGPYFHNGKVAALDQAITQMADYELGNRLSESDVKAIMTWMKCLTGDLPADYIQPPVLPKSTAKTPKPAAD